MKKIALHSVSSGFLYCASFWIVELARCEIAQFGCESSGDFRAPFIVIGASFLVIVFALLPFSVLVQRIVGVRRNLQRRLGQRVAIFVAAMIYGLLIPILFFSVVGEMRSSFLVNDGFWINAFAASLSLSIFAIASIGRFVADESNLKAG